MPRDLPLANGSLQISFDQNYQWRDLYWPHVGQECHTTGHPCRFGVWVDGDFAWIDDSGWQRDLRYAPGTLVTDVELRHPRLRLRLSCEDGVDFHENLFLRHMTIHDEAGRDRDVRLFFGHDLHISGYAVGDTAYYEPERRAVLHYKGRRWFLANVARRSADGQGWEEGVDQWAAGVKEAQGREGVWRDAEDGVLSGNAIAQGSVDSCLALHLPVPAGGAAEGWYWLAAGEDFPEVARLNRLVRQKGPGSFLERTRSYWALWGTKDGEHLPELPQELREMRRRSLLVIRSQIDNSGAILAANDSDLARLVNDTYSYMWPRDGALVADTLSEAGYAEVARHFFNFCHNIIADEGYFLHKYTPDGSLASSWHAWYVDGQKRLPVQEDETALVLWALWRHFERYHDVEFVKPLYRGLVIRAANWLQAYRDPESGLPLPSWDLWEERYGVTAWTVAATWAGLQAAASFAAAFGEEELAAGYSLTAAEICQAFETHLWLPGEERYARMLDLRSGTARRDSTVDASLAGLWYFGMLDARDPRILATMQAVRDRLWVGTEVGGVARYEGDTYYRGEGYPAGVAGNPWFIATLWLAGWHIAAAREEADLAPALELLRWVARHALPSGIIAEQIHPQTGAPLSVSPLTWSHAALVSTTSAFARKLGALKSPGPQQAAIQPNGEHAG